MSSSISTTSTRGAGPTAARHSPMTDTERRALLRIADALRSDRAYRLRLRRRGSAIAVLLGALGLTLAAPIRPLLASTSTPSAPVALYPVSAPPDRETGDRSEMSRVGKESVRTCSLGGPRYNSKQN